MIIVASQTTKRRRRSTPLRDIQPFGRLEPIAECTELPESAQQGMQELETMVADAAPVLARQLVDYTVEARRQGGLRRPLSVSILNRRRRAATLWIQAVLAGRVDTATQHTVTHSLIPQLAGTGPELDRCTAFGRDCIEFLRGLATARIFGAPTANLLPEAKALHALETVLAIHLGAVERATHAR